MPQAGVPWKEARILAVDDEEMNLELLRRILEPAGYTNLTTTTDPRRVAELYEAHQPDLILLDLKMPYLSGHDVLGLLRDLIPRDAYVPVLVLTSDDSIDARRRALSNGANDFLGKPLSPVEVRLRIRNLLQTRALHCALQTHNRELEERVQERTAELWERTVELEEARVEILVRLARAAEFRDDETGMHTQRVGETAALLAAALDLPEDEVETIGRAAPLHDIGKIGIPDAVLLKGERLSPAEFEVMKTHTLIGAEILAGSNVAVLRTGQEIALSHHERWDGTGYPHGLRGEAIPLSGRAVAVADVFDALTHPRAYKPTWTPERAMEELERQSGKQFDPRVVTAFSHLYGQGRIAQRAAALAGTA